MKQSNHWSRSLTILSVCAASVMAGVAWRSASARAVSGAEFLAPVKPTAVAVVNLKTLFEGSKEFQDGMTILESQKNDAQAALVELQNKLTTLNKNIVEMKDGPLLARFKVQQEALETEALLNARGQTSQRILQVQAGDVMRQVFEKVVKAGEKLQKQDGWDMILIDDRNVTPPERAPGEGGKEGPRLTIAQVESVIQQRHILSAVERVDITQDFVNIMNTEYGKPAAATPPVKPASKK
jgi:Skp family chaperone for outer membrane proteins